MEPMTLGSPISSPVGQTPLNIGTAATASTPYYPSYLIGESHTSPMSRFTQAGGISPGRPAVKKCPQPHFSPSSSHAVRDRFFHSTRPIGDRHFGPPISPLVGGLPQSPSGKAVGTSFVDTSKIANNSLNNTLASPALCSSPMGREINFRHSDILIETEPEIDGQHCWVTVFGFPNATASFILTQFAQNGIIVEHRLPNSGNWMHMKFQNKIQARRALGRNGKILSGKTMIGVVPCTDKSVIWPDENSLVHDGSILSQDDSICHTPRRNIRPLTQAYESSRASREVTPDCRTPRKTEGLFAKTINSILGL